MSTNSLVVIANRAAKQFGTNRATEVKVIYCRPTRVYSPVAQDEGEVSQRVLPRVIKYDGYHAESRTGIRASMAALKRFWSTYHYVPSKCVVAVADTEAVYNDDEH